MLFTITTLTNQQYKVIADSKQKLMQEIENQVNVFADKKEAFNIHLGEHLIHSDSLTVFDEDLGREVCALDQIKIEPISV